ncbi:MAG: VCBS repeat-containing protein [Sedimentisphaerales bacterium]|nr:VCBS repeat-containing protein [Sedimentisphaerales bacterium]
MSRLTVAIVIGTTVFSVPTSGQGTPGPVQWKHLSTTTGELAVPNPGNQQTAALVCDVDGDGVNDFLIAERTAAPSLVWYRRSADGWTKYTVDDRPLHIEAGSAALDIDRDGDLDVAFGGDYQQNQVWWWENPASNFDPTTPWRRHIIKAFGAPKHHDLIFGDFDGDGRDELAFWNQGARKLYLAEIPDDPRQAELWDCQAIYGYSADGELPQRQTRPYPSFKGVNEHEGLAQADIDGDGKLDIVGGGRWFKHQGGTTYAPHIIDASYQFTRAAAGQIIRGGRPEVVLVVGDGWAPLMLYEWQDSAWKATPLIEEVDCGHSLDLVDFNQDGHLDIWVAEMRLNDTNPDAKSLLLLGDGQGHFQTEIISEGIAHHESRIADLDGDGDLDILGKPYGWQTPRLDIWLNQGR